MDQAREFTRSLHGTASAHRATARCGRGPVPALSARTLIGGTDGAAAATLRDPSASQQADAAELLRADLYDLLAGLLSSPPSAAMLASLAGLRADASDVGRAIEALARLASRLDAKAVEREYNTLFIGLGRGALLPYGSYYLTGFLHEKPLAVLRRHLKLLGIVRSPDVREPEDHIATLCEVMAGLIRGRYGEPVALSEQEAFFNSHIAPWAGHFFADLEGEKSAVFYAPVGRIGRLLMDIEIEAFAIEA